MARTSSSANKNVEYGKTSQSGRKSSTTTKRNCNKSSSTTTRRNCNKASESSSSTTTRRNLKPADGTNKRVLEASDDCKCGKDCPCGSSKRGRKSSSKTNN